MTTSEDHPESLGYLDSTVRHCWEQMEAAVRLGDRATYDENRAKLFDAEAKARALLPE